MARGTGAGGLRRRVRAHTGPLTVTSWGGGVSCLLGRKRKRSDNPVSADSRWENVTRGSFCTAFYPQNTVSYQV